MKAAKHCPACGSPRTKGSSRVPDHEYRLNYVAEYVCCGNCGTLYQTPMPDVAELSNFYPATYHSFAAGSVIANIKWQMRLRRLQSFVLPPDALILDFGCGEGGFIREAARRTRDLTFWGFEIGPRKKKCVSPDGRVTMVHGSFSDLMDELPHCNLITMNHVLEHLPDPLAVLTGLVEKMMDGATMEGQTPAADSLERRVFRGAWSGYHAPRHTVVFSRRGLKVILKAARLSDPKVTAAFNPAGIAVSLASLRQGNHPGVVRRNGPAWLTYLGLATALAPLDLLSGSPGIVNYAAVKRPSVC